MRILVFNKNEKNRLVVGKLFKEMGFNVLLSTTEEELLSYIKTEMIDIIYLDVESFEDFKFELIKIMRYKKNKFLLASISQNDNYSKIDGLLDGVDDYVYNNLKLEELSAKLRAIVRIITKTSGNNNSELLSIYDLTLNPLNREVKRGENLIELTNKEFLLLEYFLRNKNRVLTRTMISEKIWDIDFITESNIVDVYINFLRGKIDKGYDKKIIRTVRSVGYIVRDENK